MRPYAASRDSWEVLAVNIVIRMEETSSCVGGTVEEDLAIMMGDMVGGVTGCGILYSLFWCGFGARNVRQC